MPEHTRKETDERVPRFELGSRLWESRVLPIELHPHIFWLGSHPDMPPSQSQLVKEQIQNNSGEHARRPANAGDPAVKTKKKARTLANPGLVVFEGLGALTRYPFPDVLAVPTPMRASPVVIPGSVSKRTSPHDAVASRSM